MIDVIVPAVTSRSRDGRLDHGSGRAFLAAAGLGILVLLLGNAVAPKGDERYEWTQYLLLGTCYPLLLAALALSSARGPVAGRLLASVESLLALLALGAGLLLVVRTQRWVVLGAALAQVLLVGVLARDRQRETSGPWWRPMTLGLDLAVAAGAWTAAAGLVMTKGILVADFIPIHRLDAVAGFRDGMLALPASLALVVANVAARPTRSAARTTAWRAAENVVALVIIGLASFRADYLLNRAALYHWGPFVGPVELVRQGEWLLWDVPAHYGFLNTVMVALMPIASAWDAFYVANAVLLFLSGSLLFFAFRFPAMGLVNALFALAVSLAAVFWLPGLPGYDGFSGVLVTPAVGPIRFIWCFVLLSVLRVAASRSQAGRPIRILLGGGWLAWLAGSLWSAESAMYCAATWLPAWVILVWHHVRRGAGGARTRLRRAAALLSAPVLLIVAATSAITGYYVLRLGQAPDWYCFAEYSVAFASGFKGLPADRLGGVWALFLVLIGLSAVLLSTARSAASFPVLASLVGAFGSLWATSSYFVSRSHEVNATNLAPIMCMAIATAVHALRLQPERGRGERWVETALGAVLAVMLALAGGSGRLSSPGAWSLRHYAWSIENRRPPMDAALSTALATAGVLPTDPIVFEEWGAPWGRRDGPPERAWLPTKPFLAFAPLAPERKKLYLSRFVERVGLGGWLVEKRSSRLSSPWGSMRWLAVQLSRTHVARRTYEKDEWRLVWFGLRHPTADPNAP